MEIKLVSLQTDRMEEMKKFYVDLFGFPLIKENNSCFRIRVGSSELEFTSENVKGNPYYHFAFNIPSNKFREAKSWVKERVELSVEDGEDEAYFSFFSAYALYFYDPAGNIVEFISRQDSEVETKPFSIDSVINISEIGLTVNDAISAGTRLIEIGINERENNPLSQTSLNFMGDKSKGIFIILNQPGRRWIFSDKISAIFPLEILTTDGNKIVVNSENLLEVDEL
ncbi:VOC family protein [Fredinandcohnia onubensis]|uniref:VOC family protein n=1 Tax=Fredinandcohnia onubensis TaxID=1571209 RepID=UPI000C0BDBDE|nr:VOC family protein [Fredinandcohnia onubensis]